MIDLQKTLNLVKGGLLDHRQTWQVYLGENHDWKETAMLLTGPLILTSVLLASIFGWIFSSHSMFAYRGGVWVTVLGLLAAAIGIAIAAFVFSYLAGVFKGKHDFNKGLAALSLSAIPGYVGGVLGTIPWIGWLIALVLFIISLVFLYKIIPLYLQVPEDKRVVHFSASLISTIVLVFIVNMIFGVGAYTAGAMNPAHMQSESSNYPAAGYGMFGDVERQTTLIEQAGKDRYTAPKNGKITDEQMANLVKVLQKTEDYRKRKNEQMKKLGEGLKDKKEYSISDFDKLRSGISIAMISANAEMEVVKSGGGNWAEYQWVKNQLRIASIQKDLNDAVKHNYALYQKYSDQLRKYGVMF